MGKSALISLLALFSVMVPSISYAGEDGEPDSFDMLGEFPTSEAASRVKPWQLRLNGLYGNLQFRSTHISSNSNFALNGVQAGLRAEIERWFHTGKKNRRNLGFISDVQFLYAGRFHAVPGDPISYLSISTMLGYRLFGFGHTVPWSPEFTLIGGPALEMFPAMTTFQHFTGGFGYNLKLPAVVGAKVGARLRFPLFSANTAIETTGYYIHPLQMLGGTSAGAVDYSSTRSLGATALLDTRIGPNMIIGAGIYWGWFKLNYTPPGAASGDTTIFYTQSLLASARFNF